MNQNSKFLVSNTSLDNVQLLHLHGYLDAHTAPDLENAISRIINKGHSNILVSFKELDYISSAGLGVFMAFIEDVRDKGGDIKLCNMKPLSCIPAEVLVTMFCGEPVLPEAT